MKSANLYRKRWLKLHRAAGLADLVAALAILHLLYMGNYRRWYMLLYMHILRLTLIVQTTLYVVIVNNIDGVMVLSIFAQLM